MKIKNALLLFDHELLRVVSPKNGHLFRTSPIINTTVPQILKFYLDHLEQFYSPRFFLPYLINETTIGYYDFMNGIIEKDFPGINHQYNELNFDKIDKKINENFYDEDKITHFHESIRKGSVDQVIGKKQKNILIELKNIFERHNTDVKIVINPLVTLEKFNDSDLKYLRVLFGKENVFDFSGENEITTNFYNYYEKTHYRLSCCLQDLTCCLWQFKSLGNAHIRKYIMLIELLTFLLVY